MMALGRLRLVVHQLVLQQQPRNYVPGNSAGTVGIRNHQILPSASPLFTPIVPLCCSTIRLHIESPIVPPRYLSKIVVATSSDMAGPISSTRNSTKSESSTSETVSCEPSGALLS